ncbi:hypothetical protein GWI33_007668 [Rhynchophorus ferrugineus]|uniref:Ig-like domain-containing protein n=1 Tax=Rhynchophorus ferrugineus TaxID=354439 RepID=A0A834MCU2_RHYFE|nr:hypothetical protein GWI33_007668 [Rhynchophorus ferrugineus]
MMKRLRRKREFNCFADPILSGRSDAWSVSWWRNQTLITDETQYFPERAKSQSILKIEKLTRSHLLAVYSCEANNSKRQPPLVVRVAIDMYLRPLEVDLIGNNPQFSAGKKYNITCKSRGSRPPAVISWWKIFDAREYQQLLPVIL